MRTIDLSPLYRSTVGFDRMATMLDQLMTGDNAAPGYPPYNIEKTGEDAYRITIAVAGFAEADLNVELRDQVLTATAKRQPAADEPKRVYLHRGIAERGFERRFQLADHVRVAGAELANGLLHIDLVREIPEALKPRTIAIGTKPAGTDRVLEA
ncbi:MAG: Hsp20 family protein [Pseudomonadota bacterium]